MPSPMLFKSLCLWGKTAALGLSLLASGAVMARDHVLIMTISNYQSGPLPGVKHDERNALDLAKAIGYDTSQPSLFKEEQLAGEGIRRALSSVLEEVQQGDRLFMYYSGHGASFPVNGGCAEALVPIDAGGDPGRMVRTSDLIGELDKVRTKLSDAFVFFDACHAGGHREMVVNSGKAQDNTMRNGVGPASSLRSKSLAVRSGEQCIKVANKSALEQYAQQQGAGKGSNSRGVNLSQARHFTFVAAARENEEALDQHDRGGLATTALLQCAQNGVANTTGTGIVSVDELQACAQRIINSTVPSISKTHKPHNIEVHVNGRKTLPSVPVANSGEPPTSLSEADRTLNVFTQIAANSNPNLGFDARFTKNQVAIGSKVDLIYSTEAPGYVNVLYIGSDFRDIAVLAENFKVQSTRNNLLGSAMVTEPRGDNHFLVMWTPDKLNVQEILRNARDGRSALSPAVAQDLGCAMESKRNIAPMVAPAKSNCSRNMVMQTATDFAKSGATGYGAVRLTVAGH